MSVTKLLSRVVSSDDDCESKSYKKGIASDALIQFVSAINGFGLVRRADNR